MQHLRCLRSENVMARTTVALLSAQVAALSQDNEALLAEVKRLNDHIRHNTVDKAEYNRVQAVLSRTQQFALKYKREARPDASASKASFKDRCLAYMAATGARSVSMPQLQAWEREQAHG